MSGKCCILCLGGSLEGVEKVREEDAGDILVVSLVFVSKSSLVEDIVLIEERAILVDGVM
jgi:hypothetical protein